MIRANNIILCRKKKILTSIFSKASGLMFSRPIKDTGYIFVFSEPRRIDLHMFFVFFPIDVLFLDDKKRIIEMKKDFLPFTFYYSKKKASYVIELPAGYSDKTKIGDIIKF
ncbi:MAG: DUF192 domain-containing protein [Candidatus Woesearchaeota archaeon]|nr:DUF192 domain-containing protein [Candidatus Woesearchaeota archaeon]